MKFHRTQILALTTWAIIGMQFQDQSAEAGLIRYSWSGRLVANNPDDPLQGDPWQLGEAGQDFTLEVAVLSDAPDLHDINVEFAAYGVDSAHLVLEGEEIPFAGRGFIDFTDRSLDGFDSLFFNGLFKQFGYAIEIGSSVVLPVDTLRFSQFVERAPLFHSTTNMLGSAYGPQGPYTGIVAPGALVRVVPEPTTVTLIVACASCCLVGFTQLRHRVVF